MKIKTRFTFGIIVLIFPLIGVAGKPIYTDTAKACCWALKGGVGALPELLLSPNGPVSVCAGGNCFSFKRSNQYPYKLECPQIHEDCLSEIKSGEEKLKPSSDLPSPVPTESSKKTIKLEQPLSSVVIHTNGAGKATTTSVPTEPIVVPNTFPNEIKFETRKNK